MVDSWTEAAVRALPVTHKPTVTVLRLLWLKHKHLERGRGHWGAAKGGRGWGFKPDLPDRPKHPSTQPSANTSKKQSTRSLQRKPSLCSPLTEAIKNWTCFVLFCVTQRPQSWLGHSLPSAILTILSTVLYIQAMLIHHKLFYPDSPVFYNPLVSV